MCVREWQDMKSLLSPPSPSLRSGFQAVSERSCQEVCTTWNSWIDAYLWFPMQERTTPRKTSWRHSSLQSRGSVGVSFITQFQTSNAPIHKVSVSWDFPLNHNSVLYRSILLSLPRRSPSSLSISLWTQLVVKKVASWAEETKRNI